MSAMSLGAAAHKAALHRTRHRFEFVGELPTTGEKHSTPWRLWMFDATVE